MTTEDVDVVILGAGVVVLTLAHALHQNGVSYQVLERDGSLDERGNGWGITLQWATPDLKQCIPREIFDNLDSITVDMEMSKKDPDHYKLRVRREGLRKLLATDVKVRWASKIRGISFEDDKIGAKVILLDDLCLKTKLVVGCDGSNSSTRRFLCPETGGLQQLPFRFLGVIVSLSPSQAAPIQKIDPLSFQGSHPDSGVYMFYSTVSTPETNGSAGSSNPYFQAQCCISWKPEDGELNLPTTSADRLQKMRELCSTMATPISTMVNEIPEGSEAIEIKLQDWPCLEWPTFDGRITLAGDAAHAMTMYRGKAANYGITDAAHLAEKIIAMSQGKLPQAQAIMEYEKDLRQRSQHGVLLSRQACVDAHDYKALRYDSPFQ